MPNVLPFNPKMQSLWLSICLPDYTKVQNQQNVLFHWFKKTTQICHKTILSKSPTTNSKWTFILDFWKMTFLWPENPHRSFLAELNQKKQGCFPKAALSNYVFQFYSTLTTFKVVCFSAVLTFKKYIPLAVSVFQRYQAFRPCDSLSLWFWKQPLVWCDKAL